MFLKGRPWECVSPFPQGLFMPPKNTPQVFFRSQNCAFGYNVWFFCKKVHIWVQKVTRSTLPNPGPEACQPLREHSLQTPEKRTLHYGHSTSCCARWRIYMFTEIHFGEMCSSPQIGARGSGLHVRIILQRSLGPGQGLAMTCTWPGHDSHAQRRDP